MSQFLKPFLPLLLGLGLLLNPYRASSDESLEEQTVLAALALNIVRFTDWPPDSTTPMKTIDFCVFGDNVVQQSFATIDNKMIGDESIHVVNLTRLRNFEACHVLYLSNIKQNILMQVFVELNNRPLLTIGEGYDFANRGGMVGLEKINDKMTLHVNLPAVRNSTLTISARLLKLANIIGK